MNLTEEIQRYEDYIVKSKTGIKEEEKAKYYNLFHFLNQPVIIRSMISAINSELAPIRTLIRTLESIYHRELDFEDKRTTRILGTMVSYILDDYGFVTEKPTTTNIGNHIKRTAKYMPTPNAKKKLNVNVSIVPYTREEDAVTVDYPLHHYKAESFVMGSCKANEEDYVPLLTRIIEDLYYYDSPEPVIYLQTPNFEEVKERFKTLFKEFYGVELDNYLTIKEKRVIDHE